MHFYSYIILYMQAYNLKKKIKQIYSFVFIVKIKFRDSFLKEVFYAHQGVV